MSTVKTYVLIDDMDEQSPANGTVTFGLDGNVYEIDLTEPHEERLRKFLERYITHARLVRKSAVRTKRK
jgi:hypothetical protein